MISGPTRSYRYSNLRAVFGSDPGLSERVLSAFTSLRESPKLASMSKSPESALQSLLESSKSLQLASVSEDGSPHCSYTPFARIDGEFVIFISHLSKHTKNLLTQRKVAAMIIADESDSAQIFARLRASYQCDVCEIARDAENYESLLNRYEAHLGKTVELLRQLPDFVLLRLVPTSGHFVMGFGEAYELTGPELNQFNHVKSVN